MSANAVEPHLPLKPAVFHILLSLANGPAHGYGIRRAVAERTQGRVLLAAGTLYETLQRLQQKGLIAEVEAPPETPSSTRWRFYGPTELGRRVLLAEIRRLEADVAVARDLLPVGRQA